MVRKNLDITPEPQTNTIYWPDIGDIDSDERVFEELWHDNEPDVHYPGLFNDIGALVIEDQEKIGRIFCNSYPNTPLKIRGNRVYSHSNVDEHGETLIMNSDVGQFVIRSGSTRTVPTPNKSIEEWERYHEIRQSKTVEPAEGQHSLHDFVGVKQVEVNPDACATDHPALDGLPAFIDNPPERSKFDPTTGTKFECSECNAKAPWKTPLEAGIDAVRPGSLYEGEPEYQSCNRTGGNIKTCDCCRCPRCHGKSIRARKTKEPPLVCNGCETGFNNPVEHDDREQRTKLYWKCGACGSATQAPFQGIPRDLIES